MLSRTEDPFGNHYLYDYVHDSDVDAHRDAECDRQGRDIGELEITAYWNYYTEGLESLGVYEELGVHRLLVNMHALRAGDVRVAMERFAEKVIAKHG